MKPSHILAALLCRSQDVMDAVVADEAPRDLVSLTLMTGVPVQVPTLKS
jgi:hypothetical protein